MCTGCLKVVEPSDSLQESRLLAKDLLWIGVVDAHGKAMVYTTVQIDLVGEANVQEQGFHLRP